MTQDERGVVLLAEADPVIGLDLTDALELAGYRVTGPIQTAAEAEAWLSRQRPTLAVIDAVLTDGSSAGLVQRLRQRGVPFLVYAAPGDYRQLAEAFAGAPCLTRPAWPGDVVDLVGQLAQPAAIPC